MKNYVQSGEPIQANKMIGGIPMRTCDALTKEELMKIINGHQKWLAGTGGARADLRRADLRGANLNGADLGGANLGCANLSDTDLRYTDLSDADLRYADLRCTNLSGANLRRTDLRCADLRCADLSGANLSGARLGNADLSDANLRGANLRYANLSDANLSDADLSGADLSYADLNGANLSGTKGLLNPIDYIMKNFEKTEDGILVYKSFGENYINPNWKIKEGSIIEEVINPLPTVDCGCGINVATKEYVKHNCYKQIWQCLIRWEWLAGVVVPYYTDGTIRASKIQLIKPVSRLDL